jgi:sugar phosphate permease
MPPGGHGDQRPSIPQRVPFFYGWIILAVGALAIFISSPGQTFSVSIFVDHIIADLDLSRSTISGLYTAGSLTAGAAVVFVGRLLDRYGARVMLTAICILFGFAAVWMSSVNSALQLYIGFALIRALGQGSLTMVPTTLIATWFIHRRGRATAIGAVGAAIGAAVFPILIHYLIAQGGWRNAWMVLAFIIWGTLLLPAVLLVRRSPEAVGLRPDGRSTVKPEQAGETAVDYTPEFSMTLGQALRTRSFWLLMFAGSAQPFIVTALTFHHVSLLAARGISPAVAASVFSVFAAIQIAGTFAAGFMADRLPNRRVLALGQSLLLATLLWTFVISTPWQAYVYGALLGACGGFLITTMAVIWPNYYGRQHLGSIRGVTTASMVVFAALGPLPFGRVFDLTGSYSTAILIFLALPVACAIAALLARPPRRN